MSLDERGRRAAESLRERVQDDLVAGPMLASLPRTRARRRMALVAPVAAAAVAVAAVLTASPGHVSTTPTGPGPTAPSSGPAVTHGNGPLFGGGDRYLRVPRGVYSPPLSSGSSPTWSPDGSRVAVLAGGVLVTDATTGSTRRLPCADCHDLAWSPDGRTFAAAGVDGLPLGLVDAATGKVTPVPLEGVTDLRSVTWAPTSDRLAFLVTSPRTLQGAYTVNRDGSDVNLFAAYPTTFDNDASGLAVLLSTRWAPTRDRIAVLSASPSIHSGVVEAPYQLVVQDYRSNGSGVNVLVRDGTCECVGFQPNMVWSPDGTTVAVFALHDRPTVSRIDGDGRTVLVRFVRGSGPLSWQPLPGGH